MPDDLCDLFTSKEHAAAALSLRDHFAALALSSLLAARVEAEHDDSEPAPLLWHSATTGLGWNYDTTPARFAALAYELADAMLLARASLTNEQLKDLAKKHPPPQSWYDENAEGLSDSRPPEAK